MGKKLVVKKESIHDFIFYQYKPARLRLLIEWFFLMAVVCLFTSHFAKESWFAFFTTVGGCICALIIIIVFCVLRRPAAADADLNGRDAAWRPA